jgi:hypothetical protein
MFFPISGTVNGNRGPQSLFDGGVWDSKKLDDAVCTSATDGAQKGVNRFSHLAACKA